MTFLFLGRDFDSDGRERRGLVETAEKGRFGDNADGSAFIILRHGREVAVAMPGRLSEKSHSWWTFSGTWTLKAGCGAERRGQLCVR